MNSTTIAALATAIPAIIGAIAALVVALKAHGTASAANDAVQSHVATMNSTPSESPTASEVQAKWQT